MAFMGVFAFLMIFIILFLIVAVFSLAVSVLTIVFSCISASKSQKFISAPRWQDYRSAKGFYIPSLVFFIVNCLFVPFNFVMVIMTILLCIDESSGSAAGADIMSFLIFLIPSAAVIVAFIMGIRALAKHSKAKSIYMCLVPPAAPYAYPQSCNTYVSRQVQVNVPPQNFYTTAEAEIKCPVCGAVNEPKHKFCTSCGATLHS